MLEFTEAEVRDAKIVKHLIDTQAQNTERPIVEMLTESFIGGVLGRLDEVADDSQMAAGMYLAISESEYNIVCAVGLLFELAKAQSRIAELEDERATRIELIIQDTSANLN